MMTRSRCRHQKQEQVHADAQPVVSRLQSSISTSLCDADPSMAYLTQLEVTYCLLSKLLCCIQVTVLQAAQPACCTRIFTVMLQG